MGNKTRWQETVHNTEAKDSWGQQGRGPWTSLAAWALDLKDDAAETRNKRIVVLS